MSDSFGQRYRVSIFGESHGPAIGVLVEGIPAGFAIDLEDIQRELKRRAPGQNKLSTPRVERDEIEILSGVYSGVTTGSAICAMIRNTNTLSKDYSKFKEVMRPGQADYPAYMKYKGFNDIRGSGHFSGRITAGLVFAGALAKQFLAQYQIVIGSHVRQVHHIYDDSFDFNSLSASQLQSLTYQSLPLLNPELKEEIEALITATKAQGDSLGGVIEAAILGVPAGIGRPFFDSIESVLSHLLFSVPAVKGVEFGSGFAIANLKGSEANDAYYYDEDLHVKTTTNHNGGITGGISNGSPIIFRCAIKPPASILKTQDTINVRTQSNTTVTVEGRHDPIIVLRALPVIEAVAAIGILDLWLGENHG